MTDFNTIIKELETAANTEKELREEIESLKSRIAEAEDNTKKNDVVGYIYILTNPSMRENLVKIGYADDVQARMKSLYNTSVCDPFECYAIYGIENRLLDKTLHELIVSFDPDLRVNSNREYFDMSPERAYEILSAIAKINNREEHLILHPYDEKEEEKVEEVTEEVSVTSSGVNPIVERFMKKHSVNKADDTDDNKKKNTYSYVDVPEGYYHNKAKTIYAYVNKKGDWTILAGSYAGVQRMKSYSVSDEFMIERSKNIEAGKFKDDVCLSGVKPSGVAAYAVLRSVDGWHYWFTEDEVSIMDAFPREKKN